MRAMLLGYLTPLTPDEPARAARLGFSCLEVHSHTFFGDAVYDSPSQRQHLLDALNGSNDAAVSISAIAHYTPAMRLRGQALIDSYQKCIDLAAACGANVV